MTTHTIPPTNPLLTLLCWYRTRRLCLLYHPPSLFLSSPAPPHPPSTTITNFTTSSSRKKTEEANYCSRSLRSTVESPAIDVDFASPRPPSRIERTEPQHLQSATYPNRRPIIGFLRPHLYTPQQDLTSTIPTSHRGSLYNGIQGTTKKTSIILRAGLSILTAEALLIHTCKWRS